MMTKFMKKLLTGLALTGLVFATPVMASEACNGAFSTEEAHDVMKSMGATIVPLSKEQVSKIIADKGPPPNADGTDDLELEMVFKGDVGAINVYQKGCYINKIGPAPKDAVYKFLGIVEG